MLSKTNNQWFAYSVLAAAGQFLCNWLWNPKIPNTENVQKAAQPIFEKTPAPPRILEAPSVLGAAAIGGAESEGMLSGVGSKIYSAAGNVFSFAWDKLSWTSKLAGVLGVAYLVNRFWKGNSGVTVNNTNNNHVNITLNFKGIVPTRLPKVVRTERKDGTSITVNVDATAPKARFQAAANKVLLQIRKQKAQAAAA